MDPPPAADIRKLEELQELYLRSNKISSLPEGLAQCTGLEAIYLEDNAMTAEGFPAALSALENMKGLTLHRNKLTSCPAVSPGLRRRAARTAPAHRTAHSPRAPRALPPAAARRRPPPARSYSSGARWRSCT